MATRVGEETDPIKMLEHLMALDFDAIEAYEAAIQATDKETYRRQLQAFKADHERHVSELAPVIRQLGGDPPQGPGAKSLMTSGKVKMGALSGDQAILRAMLANEKDTNTAYQKAAPRAPGVAREVLQRGREDERRHWDWIESTLKRD